jgi:hypothetical protein
MRSGQLLFYLMVMPMKEITEMRLLAEHPILNGSGVEEQCRDQDFDGSEGAE